MLDHFVSLVYPCPQAPSSFSTLKNGRAWELKSREADCIITQGIEPCMNSKGQGREF